MPALNASSRETKNHDAPRTSTASSTSSAAPRCSRRTPGRSGPATPRLDFAVADHVTHFTGAAVEHFSRLQSDARPAVTGRHAYSPVAAAARIAQPLGRAVLERFTVYPDRGATLGADHVAVESRSGRSDGRRCGRLVRHARLAPGVERGALLRREEQAAEFLRPAGTGRRSERQAEQEDERWLHRLAARSMIVIRSIDRKSTRLNSSHGYISYAV